MSILNDLRAAMKESLTALHWHATDDRVATKEAEQHLRSAKGNLEHGLKTLAPMFQLLTWLEFQRVRGIQVGNLDMSLVEQAGDKLMELGAICPICWINRDRAEVVIDKYCHQCGFNVEGGE